MNPADTKIIFFGNERLATGVTTDAPTLRGLLGAGYKVAAVVSHHAVSRSRQARRLEIAEVAAKHKIPVLLPEKPSEVIGQLRGYKADIAVLAAYGRIVPVSVIDLFPHGIINLHPSLLPRHRGPTPIESVILEGARETGVSIMRLAAAMDAGPIYGQARVALSGKESKQELAAKLLETGGRLLLQVLPGILDGTLEPSPQRDDAATYNTRIGKDDGALDFTKPAQRLEREVRAYAGWPRSRTRIGGKDIIVTAAHVETGTAQPGSLWRSGKQWGLYTSKDILVVDRLKPAGKQDMTAEAFLAGYGNLI